jgi:hypothetical protein
MAWVICRNCGSKRAAQPWKSSIQTEVNGCPKCVPMRLDKYIHMPKDIAKTTAQRLKDVRKKA